MAEGNSIKKKIESFKRRYYLSLSIRGVLLCLIIVLSYFLLAVILENSLWLSKSTRLVIFLAFFLIVGISIWRFLKEPIRFWINKRGLSEEESAKLIGSYFPSVADRLLNLIQLTSRAKKDELLEAGINQKSAQIKEIDFQRAVDLSQNKKYWKILLLPISVIVVLLFVDSSIFTKGTTRIIKFNQEFSPEAPFRFISTDNNLKAFFNEDFSFKIRLEGNAIPESAYLVANGQRRKMEATGDASFHYLFEKIQDPISFQIEASGFLSPIYNISVIRRPELNQLRLGLNYPLYTGRKPEEILNIGFVEIPEGTELTWKLKSVNATNASIRLGEDQTNEMQLIDNQSFIFKKRLLKSISYEISLTNKESKNRDKISYAIEVIKDQYPQIVVDNLKDSILYKFIAIGGSCKDDYGITELDLIYSVSQNGSTSKEEKLIIPITANRQQANFFYQWNIDSLNLKPGAKLNYYVEVWDNDGVNGRKSTRSSSYVFALPTKDELETEISKDQEKTESKIYESLTKARELKESIKSAEEKLRGKQNMDWQDKKMLEDLVKQKQKLDQMVRDLQKENSLLEQKKDSFSQEDERLKEKSEQLQKLMNDLLDEDTKKLFQELEKLLKENNDPQQIEKLLDKIDRKEINLEKELDRALKLFKQMKFEYKLDQAIKDVQSQEEKQNELIKDTEQAAQQENKEANQQADTTTNKLLNKQEELNKDLEKFEKSLEDLKKLGDEIKEQTNLPEEEKFEEIKQQRKESEQSIKSNKPSKALNSQKKTKESLKEVEKQMGSMQSSMEMELDMENIESMKQILHGLIKLSFDQEDLMKDFAATQPSDPKNVQISQDQLKLKDNAKVLEDSLLSLAKKDVFLGSMVTREVGELNDHIDKAVYNLKERRKSNASSEMQFSMTKINNLALMLNDHFEMMMKMAQNAKPGKGKNKKGKSSENLGMMQNKINQEIEKLRNGQRTGKQLSEDLARLAAEQERIRKALQEMQDKLKKEGGKIPGGDLPSKMEQTEMDLVNKQITEQTIRRQKEILTRLLEAEKSMREQNLDKERKGETAKEYSKEIPKAFEEYLRLKEKEVELLKTYPPKFYPYYKKEVNDYFKRIN